jgi:hypothetical protein
MYICLRYPSFHYCSLEHALALHLVLQRELLRELTGRLTAELPIPPPKIREQLDDFVVEATANMKKALQDISKAQVRMHIPSFRCAKCFTCEAGHSL